jgi:hypothetical protein
MRISILEKAMKECKYIKERLVDLLKGEISEGDLENLNSHLFSCRSCAKDASALKTVNTLLRAVEEIEPSERLWQRIEEALTPREALKRPLLPRVALASAAALLLGIIIYLLFYQPQSQPFTIVKKICHQETLTEVDKKIPLGETLKMDNYAIIEIKDRGILRVEKGTTFRFEQKERIFLQEGEIFLDLRPGRGEFVLRTPDLEVNVLGTRFGLKRGKHNGGSFVYIVEGKVMISNQKGSLVGGPGDIIYGVKGVAPTFRSTQRLYKLIAWLKRYENYAPQITIQAPKELIKDQTLHLKITISNHTTLPLVLEPLGEKPPYLSLGVIDPDGMKWYITLVKDMIKARDSPPTVNGFIKLEEGESFSILYELDPKLFSKDGLYRLKVNYICQTKVKGVWSGSIDSEYIKMEVR